MLSGAVALLPGACVIAGRSSSSTSKGGSNSTYNPQSLLSAVCCHAPVFKGKQQHDAHELMRMLLDGLQVGLLRWWWWWWGGVGGVILEVLNLT